MKLNAKGQVTIPVALRRAYALTEGDEVDVIDDGGTLRIVSGVPCDSRGLGLVTRMRGRASTSQSTDKLMWWLRGG